MWIIKWILIVISVILLIGFAMQNADISVPINFYKWTTDPELPLWLVMYLSFIAGMIFWLGVSIYQVLSLKGENRKAHKKMKSLEDELNRLRNVSVEDAVLADSAPDTSKESR